VYDNSDSNTAVHMLCYGSQRKERDHSMDFGFFFCDKDSQHVLCTRRMNDIHVGYCVEVILDTSLFKFPLFLSLTLE
jgi:hypothetical protein